MSGASSPFGVRRSRDAFVWTYEFEVTGKSAVSRRPLLRQESTSFGARIGYLPPHSAIVSSRSFSSFRTCHDGKAVWSDVDSRRVSRLPTSAGTTPGDVFAGGSKHALRLPRGFRRPNQCTLERVPLTVVGDGALKETYEAHTRPSRRNGDVGDGGVHERKPGGV